MSTHGGNLRELAAKAGMRPEDILDFSANINPLGPSERLRPAISRGVDDLVNYPDPDAANLVAAIAKRYDLPPEKIVVGNGSSEILYTLARVLGQRQALIPVPAYVDYERAAQLAGMNVMTLPLDEDKDFTLDWDQLAARLTGGQVVFLGQPNNPTGQMLDATRLRRFAKKHFSTTFVVDEAFADFVEKLDSSRGKATNVITLHSLTKFYAIPGLRLGFAVAPPALAEQIRHYIPPWSVNTLAQLAAVACLDDEEYARRTVALVQQEREFLIQKLADMPGLYVYPSQANFVLVRMNRTDMDAHGLAEQLLAGGIAIRTFAPGQHLDGRFFRLAVRKRSENERLLSAIAGALGVARAGTFKKKTPAIMFQGTSSNAGKSVLTAGLCRVLLQDGIRVAPFKSQNMSLNSYVTRDGGEMGRAQVVQAHACRLEPDVRMNPILLKPNSDTGCQVIVCGKPVGNMKVMTYIRYKDQAFLQAKECYDSLAAEYDAIVLEGAGSPGEVNLKSHDIVNMRMAEYAGSPVLVVGDIDRGGVYAAFVGTMEVLAPWERALVAGWIVNRFRGDASLLADAHDYTLAHTGRPVLGVVPYLKSLNLPQEDSVEFKSGALDAPADGQAVEIAVIDLPHISNFTDFDAFAGEADVRVRIVRSAADLQSPDAVILPGSKNTLTDLAYLKSSGLAARIVALAATGKTQVVGVCGGFQMLGQAIHDPHGIESGAGLDQGLGLLAVDTVLAEEKTLVRATARHAMSGLEVSGYEIHHGLTAPTGKKATDIQAIFTRTDGEPVGSSRADGNVWGTYLHGVFDADEFRRWFIDRLRVVRGLAPLGKVYSQYDIEPALDRLAAVVRESIDIKAIYRLMGL